jgi:hypothetical protein
MINEVGNVYKEYGTSKYFVVTSQGIDYVTQIYIDSGKVIVPSGIDQSDTLVAHYEDWREAFWYKPKPELGSLCWFNDVKDNPKVLGIYGGYTDENNIERFFDKNSNQYFNYCTPVKEHEVSFNE